jgi:uncharacterized membrane protein
MNEKTRKLTIAGMISALVLLLGLTGLGYPYVPPFKLTIVQVPVAIGAMILGPWYGLFLGLLFGLTSIYQAVLGGLPTAPMFLNPLVSVIPRMIVPLAAYFAYKLFDKVFKGKLRIATGAIGGIAASLTNTVLVLGAIYVFYGASVLGAIYVFYGASAAAMIGVAPELLFTLLLGIVFSSGVPEAVASGILCGPIMLAVSKLRKE